MDNLKQYQRELREKYKKQENNAKIHPIPKVIKPKRKLVQEIIVIDSNTRNKDDYRLPNMPRLRSRQEYNFTNNPMMVRRSERLRRRRSLFGTEESSRRMRNHRLTITEVLSSHK